MPLGVLTARQAQFVAAVEAPVVITPWRSLVICDLEEGVADTVLRVLAPLGLVFDETSHWLQVSACVGRPGCERSAADVRADAARAVDGTESEAGVAAGSTTQAATGPAADHQAKVLVATEGATASWGGRTGRRVDAVLDYVRDAAEIYRQSFATIRAEADLSCFPSDVARVVVRLVHTCGQVDLAEHVAFTPDVVSETHAALAAGAPILCDSSMVAAGITAARLPAGNEVVSLVADPAPQTLHSAGRPHVRQRQWSCGPIGSPGRCWR